MKATLLRSRQISVQPDVFVQHYSCPSVTRHARPGNFLHLLTDRSGPYFRRAMSIYGVDRKAGTFSVLFARMGRGTAVLAGMRKNDQIDVLGPLGNSFPEPGRRDTLVLVGGGVGMPPLRFLAYDLFSRRKLTPDRLHFYLGARSKNGCTAPEGLSAFRSKPIWATDDGSRGFHGTVVDALAHDLKKGFLMPEHSLVCACGPEGMLKALARLCAEKEMRCYLALERAMPCGVGVCMGCVVETVSGEGYTKYRRVCYEGTVFNAREVRL